MEKNNQHFLGIWFKTLIIIIPIICMSIIGVLEDTSNIEIIIPSFIIAIIFFYIIRNNVRRSIDKYFKHETSKELCNYYNNKIKSVHITNDIDAMLVYSKSLACCYYGEFDKVRQMLSEINWNERSPYIQSLEFLIEALICYLDSKNYEEGLRLALIAKQLGAMSNNISGSKKSKRSYETYVQVGELLSGNIKNNIIESLETKLGNSQLYDKILILYCLSKVYAQLNFIEKAKEKSNCYKKIAPYCNPLYT